MPKVPLPSWATTRTRPSGQAIAAGERTTVPVVTGVTQCQRPVCLLCQARSSSPAVVVASSSTCPAALATTAGVAVRFAGLAPAGCHAVHTRPVHWASAAVPASVRQNSSSFPAGVVNGTGVLAQLPPMFFQGDQLRLALTAVWWVTTTAPPGTVE